MNRKHIASELVKVAKDLVSRPKKTTVARDKDGQIMWVKGHTKISPLKYSHWLEAKDMESGSVSTGGLTFNPPFTLHEEYIQGGI